MLTLLSMRWHWDSVVEPLLIESGARTVVEVGAGSGHTTRRLLALARERDMKVDVIDPKPGFDADELAGSSGGRLRFHRARSHSALEQIDAPDAVLIDGDHNWYTVCGELTRLETAARKAGRPLPAVLLHDVEWPYARRDMYYDPESIPAEYRQPWARKGIVWGESKLSDSGGQWRSFANAIEEGTPRNGVLTAVEDFISGAPQRVHLRMVHGWFGLGVLAAEETLAASPGLRKEWARLASPEFMASQLERMSDWTARLMGESMERSIELARARRQLREARGEDGG
jgi:hypothetical protein